VGFLNLNEAGKWTQMKDPVMMAHECVMFRNSEISGTAVIKSFRPILQ
jgi:hypothetical protein